MHILENNKSRVIHQWSTSHQAYLKELELHTDSFHVNTSSL